MTSFARQRHRSALVTFVLGAAFAALTAAASTPVLDGYRDFSFPKGVGGNSRATGEKPESKLWYHDDSWWASLWSDSGDAFHIHRLDSMSQSWIDTGTALDDRIDSRADALLDGANLYVVSHVFAETSHPASAGDSAELYRYSYDAPSESWSLDSGFPVVVADAETETLTIAQDSAGTLWVTYVLGGQVMVNHTVGGSDTSWNATPFVLPFSEASGLSADDISSVAAYQGRVGVLWSHQNDSKMYFAAHVDADPAGSWNTTTSAVTVVFGGGADDHINMKALIGDSAGKLFVTIKTETDAQYLVVCSGSTCETNGHWNNHLISTSALTRAVVGIDLAGREIFVFSTRIGSDREIYVKRTSLDSINFNVGSPGDRVISELDVNLNDTSGFKQALTSGSQMIVIAAAKGDKRYYHGCRDLPAPAGLPTLTGYSPASGVAGNSLSISGSNFTGATDVDFPGAPGASFSVVSDTQIDVTVPGGSQSGGVAITNATGTGSTCEIAFIIQMVPSIASLAPASGAPGVQIDIQGVGFTGVTAVDFTGAPGASFAIVSDAEIEAVVPVGASTGAISVTNSAGTGVSPTFIVEVTPTVTSVAPASGIAGTSVTLTGSGFTGTTAVDFPSAPGASFTLVSDTQIGTTVPVGAATGAISVTNSAGTGASPTFTIDVVPSITSLAPASGIAETSVTLTGSGFIGTTAVDFASAPGASFTLVSGPTFTIEVTPTLTSVAPASGIAGTSVMLTGSGFTGATAVDFTSAPGASFTLVSDTQIDATVPVGAATGAVSVTNSAGTGVGPMFVVEVTPTVTSVAPASGIAGTLVTLTGSGFAGATAVDFASAPGASFTLVSDTQIDTTVPVGAATGNSAGTGVGPTFTIEVTPTVTSVAPASGIAGTSVTLTGSGFTGATAVDFPSAPGASFTLVSDTQIDATVPVATTTGAISVTNSAGTGVGPTFTIEVTPTVTSVAPASGIAGTSVTLTGS
ncbi:MAG: hypothetical protein JRG84_10905, partial [Deltaproteobacteria bacterium]|nr:hypothetical protein [Deltaproteobacteria bacterium]